MSAFAVANLKEVDDLAPRFGLAGIEARFARETLDAEQSGITYFRFEPGVASPFGHRHREQEEIYLVTHGSLRVRLDDEEVSLGPWDVLRVAPGVARAWAAGPDGAEIVAFGAQDTDRREGEAERLSDFGVERE